VVTGAAGKASLDLTRLWHRRIRMTGIMVYGDVTLHGRTMDIFDATLELIRSDDLGALGLLTHTFELEEYRDAISVALSKRDRESIKVAFRTR
jgi:threonine dehydrogenase-like Zn-dependent dehydrogenase